MNQIDYRLKTIDEADSKSTLTPDELNSITNVPYGLKYTIETTTIGRTLPRTYADSEPALMVDITKKNVAYQDKAFIMFVGDDNGLTETRISPFDNMVLNATYNIYLQRLDQKYKGCYISQIIREMFGRESGSDYTEKEAQKVLNSLHKLRSIAIEIPLIKPVIDLETGIEQTMFDDTLLSFARRHNGGKNVGSDVILFKNEPVLLAYARALNQIMEIPKELRQPPKGKRNSTNRQLINDVLLKRIVNHIRREKSKNKKSLRNEINYMNLLEECDMTDISAKVKSDRLKMIRQELDKFKELGLINGYSEYQEKGKGRYIGIKFDANIEYEF